MAMFVFPNAGQAYWMVQNNADHSYLDFLGFVYELLCLYGADHGLPHQIKTNENRDAFEDRMKHQVRNFELQVQRRDGEYGSIVKDIDDNKRTALMLHQNVAGQDILDRAVNAFLIETLDAYEFVVRTAKVHRP